jgi:hypothetical protein
MSMLTGADRGNGSLPRGGGRCVGSAGSAATPGVVGFGVFPTYVASSTPPPKNATIAKTQAAAARFGNAQ